MNSRITRVLRRRSFVCLLSVSLVGLGTALSNAQQVRIEGLLDHRVFSVSNSNDPVHRVRKNFVCEMDGCKWKIRTFNVNNEDVPGDKSLYMEVGCDGTDILSLTSYSTNLFEALLRSNATARVFPNTGEVRKGIVPRADPSHVAAVWFAYASACYLDTIRDGRLCPIWGESELVLNKIELYPHTTLRRHSIAPGVPLHVEFMNRGFTTASSRYGEEMRVNLEKPYDRGYKIAEYDAVNFTNIDNVSFPTKFTLAVFVPKIHGISSNDTRVFAVWEGVAKGFATHSGQYSHPVVPGGIVVSDKRTLDTAAGATARYIATNRWIGTNEAYYKRALATAIVDLERKRRMEPSNIRRVAWTAMVILFAVFCPLAFRQYQRHKMTKKQNG